MKKFFSLWTDSAGRAAIEAVLGTLVIASGVVYAFGVVGKPDGTILLTLFGVGLALFGINFAGNMAVDLKTPPDKE